MKQCVELCVECLVCRPRDPIYLELLCDACGQDLSKRAPAYPSITEGFYMRPSQCPCFKFCQECYGVGGSIISGFAFRKIEAQS